MVDVFHSDLYNYIHEQHHYTAFCPFIRTFFVLLQPEYRKNTAWLS